MKSAARNALSVLIAAGILIALWPLGQTAYARWSQSRLQANWRQQAAQAAQEAQVSQHTGQPQPGAASVHAQKPIAAVAHPVKAKPRPWPATRILIPAAGTDAVVVQGMDESSLRRGPGHDPNSALPGQPGNCIISGHRNVYGSYFYKIDALQPGDDITLSTPHGDYVYKMALMYSVQDNDTSAYKPIDPAIPQLTIVTCTLPHTIERVIIVAQMEQP